MVERLGDTFWVPICTFLKFSTLLAPVSWHLFMFHQAPNLERMNQIGTKNDLNLNPSKEPLVCSGHRNSGASGGDLPPNFSIFALPFFGPIQIKNTKTAHLGGHRLYLLTRAYFNVLAPFRICISSLPYPTTLIYSRPSFNPCRLKVPSAQHPQDYTDDRARGKLDNRGKHKQKPRSG